jgi:hypothetical protein
MIDLLLVVTKNPRTIEIPPYVNLYKYIIEGKNKRLDLFGSIVIEIFLPRELI